MKLVRELDNNSTETQVIYLRDVVKALVGQAVSVVCKSGKIYTGRLTAYNVYCLQIEEDTFVSDYEIESITRLDVQYGT